MVTKQQLLLPPLPDGCSWEMLFVQEVVKNTVFYRDLLKTHQNLGFPTVVRSIL